MNAMLTMDEFKMVPPPQMLWVERHYCPSIKASMSISRKSLDRFNEMLKSDACSFHFGIYSIQKSFFPHTSVFSDKIAQGEPHLTFVINIEGTDLVAMASCPFDERLYLIPYLFKLKDCQYDFLDKPTWIFQSITDRWEKLRSLDLVKNMGYTLISMWKFKDGKVTTPYTNSSIIDLVQ